MVTQPTMGCTLAKTTAVEPFAEPPSTPVLTPEPDPPVPPPPFALSADAEAAALRWPIRCRLHPIDESDLVRCTAQTLAKRGAPEPVVESARSFVRASLYAQELREKLARGSKSAPTGIGVDDERRLETAFALLDAARDGMRQNMDTPRRRHCSACLMAVATGVWPSPRWCARCSPDDLGRDLIETLNTSATSLCAAPSQ